jgi:hypothetical protein
MRTHPARVGCWLVKGINHAQLSSFERFVVPSGNAADDETQKWCPRGSATALTSTADMDVGKQERTEQTRGQGEGTCSLLVHGLVNRRARARIRGRCHVP